jgi:polyhydroxybutyrate depolymerase
MPLRSPVVLVLLVLLAGCDAASPAGVARAQSPRPLVLPAPSALASARPSALLQPGEYRWEGPYDGRTRSLLLYVPDGYTGAVPVPVVFVFHGGFGSGAQAAADYGWREKADAEGFLAVFPDGVGAVQTWNAVHCCGAALEDDVDDVGFVRYLVAGLRAVANVDPARVYAAGMSNGGMLAHRIAAELSDLFAAAAPVAGTIGGRVRRGAPVETIAPPPRPVPVILFHGREDRSVQYFGGPSESPIPTTRVDLSQEASMAFWAEANGCDPEPEVEVSDTGHVRTYRFRGCDAGADVVHVTITDQGHAWPGGRRRRLLDPPSREVSATDEAWAFFEAHPLPE